MTHKEITYSIVDVFTTTRFMGNPVAVIHDGTELSDAEMQSIAKEFGFSETTFVLPPNTKSSTAHVRIFTPVTEIPFAGHPNIGTAFVIATQSTVIGQMSAAMMIFEQLGGTVSVDLVFCNGKVTGAGILAPQRLEVLGNCDSEIVASCLSLPLSKLEIGRIEPCVASVGLPFAFVEIADLVSLSSIKPSIPFFEKAKVQGPETVDGFAVCAFVVVEELPKQISLRTRVFSPLGIPLEDPATGSASGALAALLTKPDTTSNYCVYIEQGVEMGRPSQIVVNMSSGTSKPEIVGNCVFVSSGVLYL